INSKECAETIYEVISRQHNSAYISFFAKPCSFFYGTAMNDGTSDLDLPTLYAPKLSKVSANHLLFQITKILRDFNFCTALPHQTPIRVHSRSALRGLIPIVDKG